MTAVLVRAGCFLAILVLGYVLRRVGVFGPEAFSVLSKVVIKMTLPAAIISSFVGKEINPAMLIVSLLGLGSCLLYMGLGFVTNLRNSKDRRAFEVLNLPGYNIGNFMIPFVQSFLGPLGVITCSLFDVGNAVVLLGGAYSVAAMIQDGSRFSLKRLGKTLLRSVPFVTLLIVVTMALLHIPVPGPIVELAGIMGSANAFVSMLMIGVGFRVEANREQLGRLGKIFGIRYAVAAILAVIFYFILPFELEIRQALVLLVFSPVGSAVLAFTGELKSDVGLSSAINSVSMMISIPIIVVLLIVML